MARRPSGALPVQPSQSEESLWLRPALCEQVLAAPLLVQNRSRAGLMSRRGVRCSEVIRRAFQNPHCTLTLPGRSAPWSTCFSSCLGGILGHVPEIPQSCVPSAQGLVTYYKHPGLGGRRGEWITPVIPLQHKG